MDEVNLQCIYCKRKPFEKEAHLSNHILRKHYDKLKEIADKSIIEKRNLRKIAFRIEKTPEIIKIPTEYIDSFIQEIIN